MTNRQLVVTFTLALSMPLTHAHAETQGQHPAAKSSHAQPTAITEALDATVTGKASGAILVARHGKILWVGAVGDAAHGISQPASDADFDALSIGKTFTAIAFQRLATMGKVDLEAPLRRYLPELPETLDAVTVQNCLDNASGWGPYVNDKGDFDSETATQLLSDLGHAERPHKIGEYGYSNTGFEALGLVMERVTGKPIATALHDLLLQPAEMHSTGILGSELLRHRPVAEGYVAGKPMGSPREWKSTWQLLGAAGIATTVQDLYRMNRYFLAGDGLGRNGRTRMLADGVTTRGASPFREAGRTNVTYGSGLYHWRDAQGRHVHFHGGDGDFGYHSAMYWREDDDFFVVGLFNSGKPGDTFDRAAFIEAFDKAAQAMDGGSKS